MSSAEEQHVAAETEEQQPQHQQEDGAIEEIQEQPTEHVASEHVDEHVEHTGEEQHHEHHEQEQVHEQEGVPQEDGQAAQQEESGQPAGNGAMTEFLATLNMPGISQEQIETLLAAARGNGNAGDASASYPVASNGLRNAAQGLNTQSPPSTDDSNLGNVLANLPPHLGQAASALTDLNKQPAHNAGQVEEQHVGEVEQEQDAMGTPAREPAPVEGGEEEQQEQHLQAEGGEEQAGQQQEQQQDVELKEEQHHHAGEEQHYEQSEHDATAAALAGLAAGEGGMIGPDGEPMAGSPGSASGRTKKAAGPEAERMRKDNHKEVERKRRAHISEGINRLAALIPGYDNKTQNKGAIIMSAADYIQDLKDNEASNIEKWTLEKLLMDQAMGDLQAAVENLRRENERLRAELGLPELEEGHEHQHHEQAQHQEHHAEGEEAHAHQEGEDAYTHAIGGEEHAGQEAIDPSLQGGEAGIAPKTSGSINDDALKDIAEAAAAASSAAAAADEEAHAEGQGQDEGHHQHATHHEEAQEEHMGEPMEEHTEPHHHHEDIDSGAGKIRTHDEMEQADVAAAEVDADGTSRAKRSKLA